MFLILHDYHTRCLKILIIFEDCKCQVPNFSPFFFPSFTEILLTYNVSLRYITWRFDICINCKMIITIRLANTHPSVCVCAQSFQLCLTLCHPMNCSHQLLWPWDFPGKNAGMGCYFLLQGIFLTQGWNPCLLYWQVGFLPTEPPGEPLTLPYPSIMIILGVWSLIFFFFF